MKRIAITALSALTLAGSLASTAQAADYRGNDRDRGDHRMQDRRGVYRNGHDRFDRGWRRGDRLPHGYERRYMVVDYHRAHLRRPPHGYHYVRDSRGETLLVGIATGVVLGVILSGR